MRKMLALVALTLVAVLAAATVAQAGTTQFPIYNFYNPCSGEMISMTGSFHVVGSTTFSENGGVHYMFGINTQDAHGVGQQTGATYVFPSAQHQTGNLSGLAQNVTITLHELIRAEGNQAPSFTASWTAHVTVDANGVVTVYNDPAPTFTCST